MPVQGGFPFGTSDIRVMIFVDGTNLLYRLQEMKLVVPSINALLKPLIRNRQHIRNYFYSSPPHVDRARNVHGTDVLASCRVVLGDAIPTGDGNYKEKGVDALLVADLVYHAANKNFDHAVLVSTDTDFVRALTRVEDFGCRTTVATFGVEAPQRLREAADKLIHTPRDAMLKGGVAREA